MMTDTKPLRAIDLYSGIGGWSLGLKMAGVEVVASYEWWGPANQTNQKNNGHQTTEIDIRSLALETLPSEIDFVVGSPPCTQFSYANRGGSGDIEDGLKDIEKFLEVVKHVNPTFWAMENVPRVSKILERELSPSGRLKRFAHLNASIHVVDMCEWGVPQKRKRSIIGNFDDSLLSSYRAKTTKRTLGEVIKALSQTDVVDPIYGIKLQAKALLDHVQEMPLSNEEARINCEMKTFHPVYNGMAFPDPLNKPSRTITATCTRVSRESIIVPVKKNPSLYRRLTVRERGCVQGFPITYKFFGKSFQQKLKMIGNAVPPAFTFYVAHAMKGTKLQDLPNIASNVPIFGSPNENPLVTAPDTEGAVYPANRRFRAAIPNLRLKSGVRFELSNSFETGAAKWSVKFFFGNSKAITEVALDSYIMSRLKQIPETASLLSTVGTRTNLLQTISEMKCGELQRSWTRASSIGLGPFELTDQLGTAAATVIETLTELEADLEDIVDFILIDFLSRPGIDKLRKNAVVIVAGLIVGTVANMKISAGKLEKSNNKKVA